MGAPQCADDTAAGDDYPMFHDIPRPSALSASTMSARSCIVRTLASSVASITTPNCASMAKTSSVAASESIPASLRVCADFSRSAAMPSFSLAIRSIVSSVSIRGPHSMTMSFKQHGELRDFLQQIGDALAFRTEQPEGLVEIHAVRRIDGRGEAMQVLPGVDRKSVR